MMMMMMMMVIGGGGGHCLPSGGYNTFSSCMHWGPYYLADAYNKTYKLHELENGDFNSEFHKFGMVW